jgi:hypothetical protein
VQTNSRSRRLFSARAKHTRGLCRRTRDLADRLEPLLPGGVPDVKVELRRCCDKRRSNSRRRLGLVRLVAVGIDSRGLFDVIRMTLSGRWSSGESISSVNSQRSKPFKKLSVESWRLNHTKVAGGPTSVSGRYCAQVVICGDDHSKPELCYIRRLLLAIAGPRDPAIKATELLLKKLNPDRIGQIRNVSFFCGI